MQISNTKLIERLQAQNADRAADTDGGSHPPEAVRCVTKQALQATEKSLGFKLPEMVRALYLQVGNGGFGPQYGIVGTKGGTKLDGCTLETCYQKMLSLVKENSAWKWPPQLLPLGNQGCGMRCCVDRPRVCRCFCGNPTRSTLTSKMKTLKRTGSIRSGTNSSHFSNGSRVG